MEIEVGKTYSLSNKYKKSFVEINFFQYFNEEKDRGDLPKIVQRETGWRSGTIQVTISDEDERDILQEAIDEGDGHVEMCVTDTFAEFEFNSSWDGCWEEWSAFNEEDTVLIKEAYEAFYEDEQLQEDYFNFDSYLEEALGYDLNDSEFYIVGAIEVELVDERDVV